MMISENTCKAHGRHIVGTKKAGIVILLLISIPTR